MANATRVPISMLLTRHASRTPRYCLQLQAKGDISARLANDHPQVSAISVSPGTEHYHVCISLEARQCTIAPGFRGSRRSLRTT